MKPNKLLLILLFIPFFSMVKSQSNATIKPVLNAYITLKDALVSSNYEQAIQNAKSLGNSIDAVNSNNLNKATQKLWIKVLVDLKNEVNLMATATDIDKQRDYFVTLSKHMYSLVKVNKLNKPVYYQFCPMANNGKGANWLSMENKVKNPYYGSEMLTCGKVVESL